MEKLSNGRYDDITEDEKKAAKIFWNGKVRKIKKTDNKDINISNSLAAGSLLLPLLFYFCLIGYILSKFFIKIK